MATRRRASNTSITGAVSDLQRRVRYLQAHTPPSRLSNQVVARTNIRPRAVDSDQIALQAVTNDQVAFDAIQQANLANNSVGRNEIIDGEVVRTKIGTGAVDADRLDTDAVTNSKIQNSAVTTAKLQNASVSAEKIGTSAVTVEKIRDGAVARSKIQDRAVGTGQIADSAVGNTQLATNAVGTSTLQNGSVTSGKIGSGQVNTAQIADNAVTSAKVGETNRGNIIRAGVLVNLGLTSSFVTGGLRLAPDFGTGANQVARGNHSHGTVVGLATTSSLSTHKHQVTVQATASSLRYKKDISDYSVDNLDALLNLQLKKYKYIKSLRDAHLEKNKEWMYGYIAEEVHELGLTEIVQYNKDGEPDALDYSMLSLLLLELAKRQQKEINELKDLVGKMGTSNA